MVTDTVAMAGVATVTAIVRAGATVIAGAGILAPCTAIDREPELSSKRNGRRRDSGGRRV